MGSGATDLPPGLGDHAALWLAIGAVAGWGATGATGNLVMAMATVGLLTGLTAVSAFTALVGPGSATSSRVQAGVVAAIAAGVFVIGIDHAWSWALPTVLLAVGMRAPRSRRVRLMALLVSTLMLFAAWMLALL